MTKCQDQVKNKSHKIVSIISKLIIGTLCAVLFVMIVSVLIQLSMGKQPKLFGYQLYVVATDSMTPTIAVGDVIVGKQVKDPKSLKDGDVITFVAPQGFSEIQQIIGQNITHRIIKAPYQGEDGKWYVKTKGDKPNISADPVPIPLENIKSEVVFNAYFLRGLIKFVSKWYGFLTLIILPLVGIMIYQIYILASSKVKEKIQQEQQHQQENMQKAVDEAVQQYLANKSNSNNVVQPISDQEKSQSSYENDKKEITTTDQQQNCNDFCPNSKDNEPQNDNKDKQSKNKTK